MNPVTRRTFLFLSGSLAPVFGQRTLPTHNRLEAASAAANRRLLRRGMPWFAARPEIEQAANAAAHARESVKQFQPLPRAMAVVRVPAEGDFNANVLDGAAFTDEIAANAWTSGFPIGQFLPPGPHGRTGTA